MSPKLDFGMRLLLIPIGATALFSLTPQVFAQPKGVGPVTIHIFYENTIHFTPEDSTRYDTDVVKALDRGRVISRTKLLEESLYPARVTAGIMIKPIPKDEQSVHDKWDRAGNVRLRKPGMCDLEIVKFVTSYGGETRHEVDVTHIAPLLNGDCTFLGFVDTWSSPGWTMDFWLTFKPATETDAPDWVLPLLYEESVTEETTREGPVSIPVQIPMNMDRLVLNYLVSGHCTDGRGADEFVSKDNVVTVDGQEVYRFLPWRDDCIQFRGINPYCRRWSDGSWSSDYSRSGWCPGDAVPPHPIDLTEHLPAGEHLIGFVVEDIRPKNDDGHLGYWRVSGQLLGWSQR